MFSLNTTALTKLASALINGDDNMIERLISRKLESMGEEFLMNLIPLNLGGVGRAAQAVATGGRSELDQLRAQWLSSLMPSRLPGQGIAGRLQNAFLKNEHLLYRPAGKYQKWSRSRQEWLDEKWRHDWRSQPRDWHGRWSPGRLRHPYISKGARRIRRVRRREARQMARGIVSSWGR